MCRQALAEVDLMVVHVLTEALLAGYDDGDDAVRTALEDRGRSAVTDDGRRLPELFEETGSLQVVDAVGALGLDRRSPLNDDAVHIGSGGEPLVEPPDQSVEAVVIGADGDEELFDAGGLGGGSGGATAGAAHISLPISSARGWKTSWSSHWTRKVLDRGAQSRAVSDALSMRS